MAESRELEALREGIASRQAHLRVTESLLADARAQIEAQKALLLDARSALHGYDVTIGAIRADELPAQREEVAHRISDYLFPRGGSDAPTPAAVPGLVFSAGDGATKWRVTETDADGQSYSYGPSASQPGRWVWGCEIDGPAAEYVATESEAIAAANAHNAARLKGGE